MHHVSKLKSRLWINHIPPSPPLVQDKTRPCFSLHIPPAKPFTTASPALRKKHTGRTNTPDQLTPEERLLQEAQEIKSGLQVQLPGRKITAKTQKPHRDPLEKAQDILQELSAKADKGGLQGRNFSPGDAKPAQIHANPEEVPVILKVPTPPEKLRIKPHFSSPATPVRTVVVSPGLPIVSRGLSVEPLSASEVPAVREELRILTHLSTSTRSFQARLVDRSLPLKISTLFVNKRSPIRKTIPGIDSDPFLRLTTRLSSAGQVPKTNATREERSWVGVAAETVDTKVQNVSLKAKARTEGSPLKAGFLPKQEPISQHFALEGLSQSQEVATERHSLGGATKPETLEITADRAIVRRCGPKKAPTRRVVTRRLAAGRPVAERLVTRRLTRQRLISRQSSVGRATKPESLEITADRAIVRRCGPKKAHTRRLGTQSLTRRLAAGRPVARRLVTRRLIRQRLISRQSY
ncbi:hypothetical protein BT63DRAFT_452187 [Microthyrium microscopicum]|uniref:Uncharacterized protein n=1 Tax=Microthyrium microscopicum TaxID=703497 RepID=A0A6A6UJM8_9PEZI|nr:hypothetical protein BT63DRAFT_452187 [Microthyrium microscopicum]